MFDFLDDIAPEHAAELATILKEAIRAAQNARALQILLTNLMQSVGLSEYTVRRVDYMRAVAAEEVPTMALRITEDEAACRLQPVGPQDGGFDLKGLLN